MSGDAGPGAVLLSHQCHRSSRRVYFHAFLQTFKSAIFSPFSRAKLGLGFPVGLFEPFSLVIGV